MNRFKCFCLSFVTIAVSMNINAINLRQINFHYLSVNNGLSQHDVTDIVEDSFGYIWIATYDGLNRYDGKNIQIFRHSTLDESSLSGNRIMCIMEDSQKRLWIGTDGYGINCYSLVKEQIVRIPTPTNCKVIFSFAEDKDGNIYAATDNGLLLIKPENKEIELLQLPIAGLLISDITILNDKLYLATEKGVWIFNGKQFSLIAELLQLDYMFIDSDNKDCIWVATRTGITKLNISSSPEIKGTAKIEPNNVIRSFYYNSMGQILVGTQLDGIHVFDGGNMLLEEIIRYNPENLRGLKTNTITSMLVDSHKIMWIGTNSGFYFTDLDKLPFNSFSVGDVTEQIGFIYVFEDYMYLSQGTTQSLCYDVKDVDFQLITSNLPLDMKEIVSVDGRNMIASGTGLYIQKSKGVHDYVPYKLDIKNDSNRSTIYTSLAVDDFGNKYIGTWNGLIIEKKNGETDWIDNWFKKAKVLRNERIYDLYYDTSCRIVWIGTVASGLYKINLDDSGEILTFQNYNINANDDFYISCNQIWVIYRSINGVIWLGTDAGLFYKNIEDECFIQVENREILDKKIMSILEDNEGNLWMGSSQGLIRYSPSTEQAKKFAYSDGLQSNTFTEAASKAENGELFFGGIEGINWFNPADIVSINVPPQITLTGIMINNEHIHPTSDNNYNSVLDSTINLKSSLTLTHDQNNFAIEFMTIPFNNIRKYNTRYMLKGIDEDWVNTTNTNMVSWYKNLPSGKYTFLIESYVVDESDILASRYIDLHIKPAPWATLWAYLIYFVTISFVTYALRHGYKRHRKLKDQIEIDKIYIEQEEKINEMKLVYFTDIAHEFKTPLSLIVGPINDLIEQGPANSKQEFCFNIISRNVRRMMHLTSQLLDFRKITNNSFSLNVAELDLVEFVEQVSKTFEWEAKHLDIEFKVSTPAELICWFDPNIIEKALYNILSNAFQYTEQGGIVEVNVIDIWKNGTQLAEISVADNGPGIDDSMKQRVFERFYHGSNSASSGVGLHLTDQLIKVHHGEIILSDSIYQGAEFKISFPASVDLYNMNEFQHVEDEDINKPWITEESFTDEESIGITNNAQIDRLLIVEDDFDLRYYLKKCLESRFIISEAQNGAEGLKKAEKTIPDLIISDVMMPKMDGIEMTRKIKNDVLLSHIPIILLTAKTDIEHQKEGFEVGAFDYICKPFNTKILIKKIESIIEQQTAYKNYILTENGTIEVSRNYTSYDRKLMDKLNAVIEKNLDNSELTVELLAKKIGVSRMHLHRKIKAITGETTTSYINLIKMKCARKMFDDGCDRVQEVMDAVGINSSSYFNKLFKTHYNETPSSYILKKHYPLIGKDS